MSIFLSGPGQIVFYAVFFSIFLCSHSLLILTRIRHAPSQKAKFGPGARSILVAGSLFLWSLVLVSAWFGYAGIGVLPDWTYYLGLSLSILGNAIWFWGHQTFGPALLPSVSDLPRSSVGGEGAVQVRAASHVIGSYSCVSGYRMGGSVLGSRGHHHSPNGHSGCYILWISHSQGGEGPRLRVW